MHKLSHVEAQRVIGVLNETLERLVCVAKVPEYQTTRLFNELEDGKCFEVLQGLRGQFQLEEALMVESKKVNSKDAVALLEKKLRANTRTVCRALREDSVATKILEQEIEIAREEQQEFEREQAGEDDVGAPESKYIDDEDEQMKLKNGSDTVYLQRTLRDLRDVVFRSLTTTVEDEHQQKQMFHTVSTREKEADEDRKTLEQQLGIEKRNRSRSIADLDSQVAKLQAELRDIKQSFELEEATLDSETKEEMGRIKTQHEQARKSLTEQEQKLSDEVDNLSKEMSDTESQLRKKKNKYEAEVNALIERYDQDLNHKQQELDNLRNLYDREKKHLKELEEYFEKVDEENERIAREEAEWAKYLEEKYQEERIYDDGAVGIQKLWRGYLGRVAFEAFAKKSKKGKKSKK